jgi:hypothetical protein
MSGFHFGKLPFDCPGVDLEINSVNEGSFAAGSTINITLTDGTNPVTPESVTVVGNDVEVEVPSGGGSLPEGIAYQEPNNHNFSNTMYAVGDAKWRYDNNLYMREQPTTPVYYQKLDPNSTDPINTLLYDNIFGNRLRFTDDNGDAIIDLTTQILQGVYDHLTGRIWKRGISNAFRTWEPALNLELSNGYMVASREEYMTLKTMDVSTITNLQINNQSLAFILGASRFPWTCNTDEANTSNAIRLDNAGLPTLTLDKTNTSRTLIVVKFIP